MPLYCTDCRKEVFPEKRPYLNSLCARCFDIYKAVKDHLAFRRSL